MSGICTANMYKDRVTEAEERGRIRRESQGVTYFLPKQAITCHNGSNTTQLDICIKLSTLYGLHAITTSTGLKQGKSIYQSILIDTDDELLDNNNLGGYASNLELDRLREYQHHPVTLRVDLAARHHTIQQVSSARKRTFLLRTKIP